MRTWRRRNGAYYKQFEVFSVNATVICPNTSTAMPVATYHTGIQPRTQSREHIITSCLHILRVWIGYFSNGTEGPCPRQNFSLCELHSALFSTSDVPKSRIDHVLIMFRVFTSIEHCNERSLHDALLRRPVFTSDRCVWRHRSRDAPASSCLSTFPSPTSTTVCFRLGCCCCCCCSSVHCWSRRWSGDELLTHNIDWRSSSVAETDNNKVV